MCHNLILQNHQILGVCFSQTHSEFFSCHLHEVGFPHCPNGSTVPCRAKPLLRRRRHECCRARRGLLLHGERKFAQAAKPEPKLLRKRMTRHTENPDTPKISEERAMQNPGALKHRHRALAPASTEEDLNSGALKHRRVSLAP